MSSGAESTVVEAAANGLAELSMDAESENLGAEAKHNSNSSVNADTIDGEAGSLEVEAGDEEEEEEEEENNGPIFRHPAELLTDTEISMLETLFKEMNTNGDGILKPKQMAEAMKTVGANVDEETLRRQLKMGDGEDEGIDVGEFVHMMAIHMKRKLSEDDVQLAFSSFDLNGDGFIDKTELTTAMQHIGFQMEPEEIEEMIQDADKDGDGRISFEEFKEKMLIFGGNMSGPDQHQEVRGSGEAGDQDGVTSSADAEEEEEEAAGDE